MATATGATTAVITIAVTDFGQWRDEARRLLLQRIPPDQILWIDGQGPQEALPFATAAAGNEVAPSGPSMPPPSPPRVPRRFMELAEVAACHRDADRWPLLYRLLWRIQENREILDDASDTDVSALEQMVAQVRRDLPATLGEMPLRRWAGLPEASLIPSLVSSTHERTSALQRTASASARPFVPETTSLQKLHDAAAECQGCDLYKLATQVVFGEGRRDARLVLVGEQPGDMEDVAGRPFVGPAGQVLDRALVAAKIDRADVYVTNAVKHFSFEERGKRRIHKTPRVSEMRACRPWVEAELHAIQPACVVCLGSTAARSLLGPEVRVMEARGKVVENTSWAPTVIVTIHPSAVLRADDGEKYFEMLVSDLKLAAAVLAGKTSPKT